jgi:hypothetical protein
MAEWIEWLSSFQLLGRQAEYEREGAHSRVVLKHHLQ